MVAVRCSVSAQVERGGGSYLDGTDEGALPGDGVGERDRAEGREVDDDLVPAVWEARGVGVLDEGRAGRPVLQK